MMGNLIHRVEYKDTLYTIGRKYGVPPYIIARENDISEIKVGMRLIIPSVKGIKYVVKPYETLEQIAIEQSIDIQELREINMGIDQVFLGQIIYLPYKE